MPSKFKPQTYHHHSIRLKGYDYASPGAYFITIVTYQRECLFGEIENGEMKLSDYGKIVNECWQSIPDHFPNAELGAYTVMPNHIHGVIIIHGRNHRTAVYPPSVGAQHAAPLM
jgi:REP element-mobilizing transposase RayT